MKALVIEKHNGVSELVFRDSPDPVPATGEALVKVLLAGICRTDLELVKGYMDFTGIPGHEFVGRVTQVNSDSPDVDHWMGRRVVGEINCGCGNCSWCRSGMQRHCPDRTVLGIAGRNGAFAEYLTIPVENLLEVPDKMDDQTAVFTELLAAALEILEQVKIPPDSEVLVVGDGKLGLLICRVLQLHGCNVFCLGGSKTKMSILHDWGIKAEHYKSSFSDLFHFTVEASGTAEGFQTAMKHLHPRGTLILKSTYAGNLEVNTAPWVVNEQTIVGSRCGRFKPAINLLEQHQLEIKSLITEIFPFKMVLSAFEMAGESESLKVLLDFRGSD